MGNVNSSNVPVAAMAGSAGGGDLCGYGSTGNGGIGLSPAAAAAAADAAAAAAADAAAEGAAAAAGIDTSTPSGRHRKRLLQLEAKLQRCMDAEDRRVKELTEGVLYELLPSALNVMLPHCEDPLQELDAERCRAVAGAALAVSSLMNAPPGFLEFLLCIPWRQLHRLYPAVNSGGSSGSGSGSGSGSSSPGQQTPEQLLAHLAVDEAERRLLVNMRIHPQLMRPVLDFLYRPEHADSVPPLLRPPAPAQPAAPAAAGSSQQQAAGQEGGGAAAGAAAPAAGAPQCTADPWLLAVVGALLDGATPLHCAALRGNPAQVDHLLFCGADPTIKTAAGELPLELVPVCGSALRESGQRQCCCLGPVDQEVWECRSRIARSLIARRCMWMALVSLSLVRIIALAWLCIPALLGLYAGNTSLQRPVLQAHVQRRRQQRLQDARTRTCALLARMRQEASTGRLHLNTARQKAGCRPLQAAAAAVVGPLGAKQDADAGGPARACDGVADDDGAAHTSVDAGCHGSLSAGVAAEGAAGPGPDSGSADKPSAQPSSAPEPLEPLAPATPSAAAEAAGGLSGTAMGDACVGDPAASSAAAGGDGAAACTRGGQPPDGSGSGSSAATAVQPQPAAAGPGAGRGQASSSEVSPCAPEPDSSAELAFKCYVRAVHALQSLDLQGGVVPHMVIDGSDALVSSSDGSSGGGSAAAADLAAVADGVGGKGSSPVEQLEVATLMVLEDEQAELYCCWAEAVLLKSNDCSCPGCTSLAVQAIRMAHIAAARLFGRMQKAAAQRPRCWRAVGQSLSRVVWAHIALLCRTEAAASPSRASVWRAQQCLQEWDKLAAAGLLAPDGPTSLIDTQLVDALRMWTRTAESDLLIAEALLGSSLAPTTTLAEALAAALVHIPNMTAGPAADIGAAGSAPGSSSASCLPVLSRPVSAALLDQLQVARGLAVCPSPAVKRLAAQVADATARELSAAARLRELLSGRSQPVTSDGVSALAEAIAAAAPFSSLASDVEAARALHRQCCQRAEAAAKLQGVVDQVLQLTIQVSARPPAGAAATAAASAGPALLHGFAPADWERCIALLEAAVEEAKDANVSVIKARKLVKELQSQLAAAEAASALDALMARRPCGSAALRAAMSKGEAAAAGIATGGASSLSAVSSGSGSSSGTTMSRSNSGSAPQAALGGGCGLFSEALLQRLAAAKRRLEVERAAEALHKASLAYRGLGDLAKLEAAILNARKVGAEELAPEEYRVASELRARLTAAARVKAALDGALRGLLAAGGGGGVSGDRGGRALEELEEPVQAAIREAARWEELLPGEAARAGEVLEAWRTSSACEAKLSRALRDGSSSALLSRLISEAAAAGVKVAGARRVLKLQQLLEAAMAAADEAAGGSGQYGQLAAKLEAAEQGGVAQPVLEPARRLLKKLLAVDAKSALEAALKPHSDWSANTRMAALRAALDKAEDVLGLPASELVQQQQQQEEATEQPAAEAGVAGCQQDADGDGAAAAADGDGPCAEQAAGKQQQQQQEQHDDELQSVSAAGESTAGSEDEGMSPAEASTPPAADQAATDAAAATAAEDAAEAAAAAVASPDSRLPQASSVNLSRTDSMASSSAASDLSSAAALSAGGSAAAAAGAAAAGGRGDSQEAVLAAVRELAVRAWLLLEQDQRQLEEIDRERAEQERARRELKEKERQERQRAEAERAERGRAERQRALAERRQARAKAAAERSKGLAVLWGSAAGSSSSSSSAVRSASSGSAKSAGAGKREAAAAADGRRSSGSGAGAASPELRPKQAHSQRHAKAAGSQAASRQSKGLSSPQAHPAAAAAGSLQPELAAAGLQSPRLQGNAVGWAIGQQLAAPGSLAPGSSLLGGLVQHSRSASYDLLGSEVLALLDLHDAQPSRAAGPAGCQQQQQQRMAPRSGLTLDVSSGPGGDDAPRGKQPAAEAGGGAAGDGGTPKFSFVDLGGAAWGLDGSDHMLQLGQPLPSTAAMGGSALALPAASAGLVGGDVATAADLLQLPGDAAGSHGIWGSSLGLGLTDSSAALPPLAPKGQQLHPRLGRVHRSNTDDGSSSGLGAGADVAGGMQRHLGSSLDSLSIIGAGAGGEYVLPGILSPLGSEAAGAAPQAASLRCFGGASGGASSGGLLLPVSTGLVPGVLGGGASGSLHGFALSDYNSAAGDLALLSRGAASPLGLSVAASQQGWASAQQQQQQQQQQHLGLQQAPGQASLVATAAAAAAAATMAANQAVAADGPAAYGGSGLSLAGPAAALQQQQQQQQYVQLQQAQLQQLHAQRQQHGAAFGSSSSSSLTGVGAVGQFSSSFAFGAPGLSAFSQAYTPATSGSLARSPIGAAAAAAAKPGDTVQGGDAGSSDGQPAVGHHQAQPTSSFDAASQLPDDLA